MSSQRPSSSVSFLAIPFLVLTALVGCLGCSSANHVDFASNRGDKTTEKVAAPLPPRSLSGLFTDVTFPAGITVHHRLPTSELTNIVDATGSGAAFTDLDGDGWLDLVVLRGPFSPAMGESSDGHAGFRLYRNLQNGRFEDITARSGVPAEASAVAVAVADVDGDGDRDLYLVDRGRNRLYRNRGNATFENVTGSAGVGDARFGVGAVFFDMDEDWDPDLYVTNYLEYDAQVVAHYEPDGFPGPLSYKPEPDVLYRNRGDGTFEDVSTSSGVGTLTGRGMSLATGDFYNDGDIDIFVANDSTANFFLINDGEGRFRDAALLSGVALGENGEETSAMAADVGDVNGDGQLDIAVSDTAFGALYLRLRPGVFTDEVMQSGVGLACGQYVSWGQNLLDYDNDGDLDLFVANGGLHHLVGWEDLLLRNDGSGRFEDASMQAGAYFKTQNVGRSSIVGDYDNDGDIDLFVSTLNGRHFLLRNDLGGEASWITLDLVGDVFRDPFGAKVEVQASGRSFVSESRCPSGYLGQSDPRVHIGLGEGVEKLDTIRIMWPDGTVRVLTDVPARQILRVKKEAN